MGSYLGSMENAPEFPRSICEVTKPQGQLCETEQHHVAKLDETSGDLDVYSTELVVNSVPDSREFSYFIRSLTA